MTLIVDPKTYHWLCTWEAHPTSTPYLVKLRHERDWRVGEAISDAFAALHPPALPFHPFREQQEREQQECDR